MKRVLMFAIFLISVPLYSFACRVTKPLTTEQTAKADVVFEGRAITVSTPDCTGICKGTIVGPRSVTFTIDKIVSGKKLSDNVEVYWQNGSFGEVDTALEFWSRYGRRSRVGIIMPETIKKNTRCEMKAAVTGLGKPTTVERCETNLPLPFLPLANTTTDKPWIISDVCSESFITSISN